MNRIEKKFRQLKRNNQKALIVFITGGYPNLRVTKKLILALDKIGVDILEIGIPFSDPLADGPIIQESSQKALKNKVNLIQILHLIKEARKHSSIPITLMTYYNPIFCFGEERFLRVATSAGVDGVIVPDLPPEEGRPLIKLANKYNLDVICFISPTTPLSRIKYIARIAKGFIYYVSLTGVTGPRSTLPKELKAQVRMIKKITPKPICVGFGISGAEQAREIYKIADGVIVGSAVIKKIKQNLTKSDLLRRVIKFVAGLKP